MTTISIEKRMDELDIAKMLEDERVPEAINEILRAMAIDESIRVIWPDCPMDQMYASLNEWKDTLLAARDYKQGDLSAEMYRARLAMLAGVVLRAMVNVEV
jgi:hypothetical protein